MNTDILLALILDLLVVSASTFILLRHGRLAHSHPATIYLFFHLYTFTLRLVGLSLGAETLFSGWSGSYSPVQYSEIIWAARIGDLALVVMVVAWVKAANDYYIKGKGFYQEAERNLTREARAVAMLLLLRRALDPNSGVLTQLKKRQRQNLSLFHIWRVAGVALPIGLIGLLSLSQVPGVENNVNLGNWQSSSYISITQTWIGLALVALIYWYGFRWWLMSPMVLYLGIMSIQGYSRFRVFIPIILLVQIYLDRHNMKWPPTPVLLILLTLVLLFYPLKSIGLMVNQGAPLSKIASSSLTVTREALSGEHGDQQFLDQFASALTLFDKKGKFYYGRTYLALLTLPVPRQWWPGKPGLVDHLKDFSTRSRPMAATGMVITFLGESYINFGYIGIICISFLIAYWLARVYFSAYRRNYFSIERFFYLIVACNLIQVFRDGLLSIIIFTMVNMLPLMIIVLLHYLLPIKKNSWQAR